MKRTLVVAGLLLAVGVQVAASTGGGADGSAVFGKGKDSGGASFAFEHDGAIGSDVRRVVVAIPGIVGPVEGRATCLAVVGDRAAISGPGVSAGGLEVGFMIVVEDNGRNRRRPKDRMFVGVNFPNDDCGGELGRTDLKRIARGDVRID